MIFEGEMALDHESVYILRVARHCNQRDRHAAYKRPVIRKMLVEQGNKICKRLLPCRIRLSLFCQAPPAVDSSVD